MARTPPDPPGTIAEVEPNNSRAASQLISTDNTTVNGTIGSTSDNDYYRLTLPAGGTLVATLTPNATLGLRPVRVQQQRRADRQQRELGTGAVDTVTVTNTGTSAFARYVRVVRWSGGTGATNGRYTVNMNW